MAIREPLELFVTDAGRPVAYKVVASSPGEGQAVAVVEIDATAPPLDGLIDLPERPTYEGELRTAGTALFEKLFVGDVRTLFDRVLGRVAGRGAAGLDLILRIDPPELAVLPWELLFAPDLQLFLATAPGITLSRSLTLVEPVRSLTASDGLRILKVRPLSSGLDTGAEDDVMVQIRSALDVYIHTEGLEGRAVTLGALREALQRAPHVVHFAGHAAFQEDDAVIYLDDREGLPSPVPAPVLAQVFLDRPSVRLVVLNACEGATRSAHRALAGIAPWLLRRGVPAVVAMQWPIRNSDAGLFATELYRELTSRGGGDLGVALARARGALFQEKPYSPAFANAVLYLRAPDPRLIGHTEAPAESGEPVRPRRLEPAPFLVPFPRNPDFVGRTSELEELHRQLVQDGSPVGIRPTGVVGLGGIGKTQLAVEYAHTYRGEYSGGVFWINASGPLVQAFSDLAALLGLGDPAQGQGQEQAVFAVWQYLAARPDALLIFDNALDPSELCRPVIAGLVPANLNCRILFTTRRRDFPRELRPFELAVLPEGAALKLLLRARPEVLRENHPDWGTSRIVCASLGRLPLALELAAAYLEAFPEIPLDGYLLRLRTEGKLRTVDDPDLADTGLRTRHGEAVEATLRTQWTTLRDRRARLLLQAAAQFQEAELLPLARLGLLTGLGSEPGPGRPSPLQKAVRTLCAVSLVEELSNERLRLHPLVQEFVARRTPARLVRQLSERLARAVEDLSRLEDQVAMRGVFAVLGDVRAGLRLAGEEPPSPLLDLERLLDREAHTLSGWSREVRPVAFSQQAYLRATDLSIDFLARQAESRLVTAGQPFLDLMWRRGPSTAALIRTLGGSGSLAGAVAITEDGLRVLSGYEDGSLRIWDLATGQLLRGLEAHEARINTLCIVPGMDSVLSASDDHTLRLWDLGTGQLIRTFIGHRGRILGAVLLPDGGGALSASWDRTVRLWDLRTGALLKTLEATEPLDSPAVVPGRQGALVVAVGGKRVWAWNLETGEVGEPPLPALARSAASTLAVGEDCIVVGSREHLLEIHDLKSGRTTETEPPEQGNMIFGIAFVPGCRIVILALLNRRLEAWDLEAGRRLATWPGHENFVRDVVASPDGRLVVSASNDGTVKIWNLAQLLQESPIEIHLGPVDGLAWFPGDRLVSGAYDGSIQTWQADIGEPGVRLGPHEGGVQQLIRSPAGDLVSGGYTGGLRLWDAETGAFRRRFDRHRRTVWGMAGTPDGQRLISFGDDWTIRWWDVSSGEVVRILFDKALLTAAGVALAQGGKLLVVGPHLLHGETAEPLATLEPGTGWPVSRMACLPDGERILLTSGPEIQLWDLGERHRMAVFTGHRELVTALAVSENGRFAASGSLDRELKVWDLEEHKEVAAARLDVHVRSLALAGGVHGLRIFAGDMAGGVCSFRLRLPAIEIQ